MILLKRQDMITKMECKKLKINVLRVILIALLLETFFVIFGFSNQNAEESSSLSTKVAKFVLKQVYGSEEKIEQPVLERTQKVIRKLAHFSIYTLVGFLLMSFVSTYNLDEKKRCLISLGIGIIYATSDEIHQAFVPGRGPQITDVMIDTMGVLLGLLIVLTIIELYKKIKK